VVEQRWLVGESSTVFLRDSVQDPPLLLSNHELLDAGLAIDSRREVGQAVLARFPPFHQNIEGLSQIEGFRLFKGHQIRIKPRVA